MARRARSLAVAGDLTCKILVDATNPLLADLSGLELGIMPPGRRRKAKVNALAAKLGFDAFVGSPRQGRLLEPFACFELRSPSTLTAISPFAMLGRPAPRMLNFL